MMIDALIEVLIKYFSLKSITILFIFGSETVLGQMTRSIKNNISIVYCNNINNTNYADNCTQGIFATTQYFKYFSIVPIKTAILKLKVNNFNIENMCWV